MDQALLKKVAAGAVIGFAAMFAQDISKWASSNEPFDFKIAAKRWIAGAVAGATGALGVNIAQ